MVDCNYLELVFIKTLHDMCATKVSIWLALWSVLVEVMAHGVDLPLHARVSIFSVTSGISNSFTLLLAY